MLGELGCLFGGRRVPGGEAMGRGPGQPMGGMEPCLCLEVLVAHRSPIRAARSVP